MNADLYSISDPKALKDWAESCGLKMADVCTEAGVARSTFWRWETGRTGMTRPIYIRLVDALKALRDEKARREAE